MEVTDAEKLCAKMTDNCFYCNISTKEQAKLSGVDRIDLAESYSDDNTVPLCCSPCNYVKRVMSVDLFIESVRNIVSYRSDDEEAFGNMQTNTAPCLHYREKTRNRHKVLPLTDLILLWSSYCYLCGRGPALGIDRQDSSENYTAENAMPCCTTCNFMKQVMPIHEFVSHVRKIHAWTCYYVLRDVSNEIMTCAEGNRAGAIAARPALDQPFTLAFSSASTAEDVVGGCQKQMKKHVGTAVKYRGFYWEYVDAATYKAFRCDHNTCKLFIETCRSSRGKSG
jgi:hypothetical protein